MGTESKHAALTQTESLQRMLTEVATVEHEYLRDHVDAPSGTRSGAGLSARDRRAIRRVAKKLGAAGTAELLHTTARLVDQVDSMQGNLSPDSAPDATQVAHHGRTLVLCA